MWLPLSVFAQNDDKRDNTWLFGYPPNSPSEGYGGTVVNFSMGYPKVSFFNLGYAFQTSSAMCNEIGDLLFYSNGCHVINSKHQIMPNGTPLNPGHFFDVYCPNWGYPLSQSAISLPTPNHIGHYSLFHLSADYVNNSIACNKTLYSLISIKGIDEVGEVISRNQLVSTQLSSSCITATRHGNGRDWRLVVPALDGKRYFMFLLDADGVTGPSVHTCTKTVQPLWTGQIAFCPDGTWFADCQGNSEMRLMRFDRCSGQFYGELAFDFQGDTVPSMGVAFSPDSKVMYVSSPVKIYQYDLTASDVPASRQVVAEYDGFAPNGFPTTFFQAMLAPDNKIYLTATGSTKYLHIIHSPNNLGTACNVEQHGLELATRHAFMVPNFPYFRLYDLPGSPCDTLGINGPVSAVGEPQSEDEQTEIRLWPNPATDLLTIQYPNVSEASAWLITNAYGQIMQRGEWVVGAATTEVDISKLPSGSYFFRLQGQDGRSSSRLFMVLRE